MLESKHYVIPRCLLFFAEETPDGTPVANCSFVTFGRVTTSDNEVGDNDAGDEEVGEKVAEAREQG